jgi:hypothetical protein
MEENYRQEGRKMKIAIAIDDWKLAIFSRRLTDAGFTFDKVQTGSMIILTIIVDFAEELRPIVEAANLEAQHSKLH